MNRRTNAFRANGAAFIQSLGQRPRFHESEYPSAESATHFSVESRLQCLFDVPLGNPGGLPQTDLNRAPLARKRCGRILSFLVCLLLVGVAGVAFAEGFEELLRTGEVRARLAVHHVDGAEQ